MTLTDARALRDSIRKRDIHCTVPLGYGPDGYFARIVTQEGAVDFYSTGEWDAYRRDRASQERKKLQEWGERHGIDFGMHRPRSPIEAMIDQACGITEKDYRGRP